LAIEIFTVKGGVGPYRGDPIAQNVNHRAMQQM
jgi:hypothetical protein